MKTKIISILLIFLFIFIFVSPIFATSTHQKMVEHKVTPTSEGIFTTLAIIAGTWVIGHIVDDVDDWLWEQTKKGCKWLVKKAGNWYIEYKNTDSLKSYCSDLTNRIENEYLSKGESVQVDYNIEWDDGEPTIILTINY